VADLRAPTPSAAAMQSLPDGQALSRLIGRDLGRLLSATRAQIDGHSARLDRLGQVLRARSPRARVALARSRAERAVTAADQAMIRHLDRRRRRLAEAASRLEALSPLGVLGRGYALVRRERDGAILRAATEVEVGERLDVRLARGRIAAEVVETESDEGLV